MTKFDIKNCPLCKKVMKLDWDGAINVYDKRYYCTEVVQALHILSDGYQTSFMFPHSHYEVQIKGSLIKQIVILEPYQLVTELGSATTFIYKFPLKTSGGEGDLIMKVPTLTLEDPEHLRKRLKTWVVFS